MKNFYKIDANAHYFVPLRPKHNYGFISMTCDSDPVHMIECELKPYEFDGFNYKVYAVPIDLIAKMRFGKECYCASDFESLVKSGHIVKKTSNTMKDVQMKSLEPLCGSAYLIHNFETIIE